MTNAELWGAWRLWMMVAVLVILIAATLLITIWLTARSILAHARRALAAAEKIRANTQPIWALETTNEVATEILEELPHVEKVLVPFGGGGLACGIASALKALEPGARVIACEVETAAPLTRSLAAGSPQTVDYTPSFVDGAGSSGLLPEMWHMIRNLIEGSAVVTLEETAEAIRLLVERMRVVAEGAGALPLAAALSGKAGGGTICCVISGGNIDPARLAAILTKAPGATSAGS